MVKNFIDGKNFLFLLLIFAIFYELNTLMPLHRDDYEYALIWGTERHIESFADVFSSLKNHYFLHGGRMVSFFVLDTFLLFGKEYFNFFNALMFVFLIAVIFMHARQRFSLRGEFGILVTIFILAYFSYPHFGEVIIWMCGSCVYLWTGVLAGIFLLPYNLYLKNQNSFSYPFVSTIVMFFLGILAGCSVENLAISVSTIAFFITVYTYKKGIFKFYLASGTIGAILGSLILILAPGNYVRYDEASDKGFLLHIANQFAGNGEMLLYLIPLILLLYLLYQILKREVLPKVECMLKEKKRKNYPYVLLFLIFASFLMSSFQGNFISNYIRDFVIIYIMPFFNIANAKTIRLFTNTMAGLEEIMIWLFGIYLIYLLTKNTLAISEEKNKEYSRAYVLQLLCKKYFAVRYAIFLFALALLNNFYMIFAPTFPARATFFSVTLILVATANLCRNEAVKKAFYGKASTVIFASSIFMVAFLVSQSFFTLRILAAEDAKRVEIIKAGGEKSLHTVILEPIEHQKRVLRHVYYVDFDNVVTKTGIARYFQVQDIKVKK